MNFIDIKGESVLIKEIRYYSLQKMLYYFNNNLIIWKYYYIAIEIDNIQLNMPFSRGI